MELYPAANALHLSVRQKLSATVKIWGLCLLLILAGGILIMTPANLILKSQLHIDIYSTNRVTNMIETPAGKYVITPILAPLLEEILFRLWQDYRVKHILISSTLLILVLAPKALNLGNQTYKYLYMGIIVLCSTVAILKKGYGQQILPIPLKTRKCIFYIAAVLFGLVHISNFSPFYPNLFLIYPVFVLPQLIMGFGFGYVRIKYGFFYGFIIHFMVNLMFVLFHL